MHLSACCRTTMDRLARSAGMRLLIVAAFLCLGACAETTPDLNSNVDMTKEAQQAAGRCAKIAELTLGMTTSQVVSSCERTPQRTQEVIIKGGKHQILWSYTNGHLEFESDKLTRIRPL